MVILDGKKLADLKLQNLKTTIATLQGRRPKLAVIRVGDDPASQIYVSKKIRDCERVGILSEEIHLSASTSEPELLKHIHRLNQESETNGILVQLPLPPQISVQKVIESIDPQKDVDGFHPFNLGRLASMEECFQACTPRGIMSLLDHYQIRVKGMRAVVIGRSRTVGRPMSLLLDQAGATVTVVHKETKNPQGINVQADLLVVAAGVRGLIGPHDVKDSAVVIDVGIHRTESGKIVGDVEFDQVKSKVSAITPVPGGVGPMTVCSLLENTFLAFQRQSR